MKLSEQKHVIYMLDKDFTKEEFYSKFGKGSAFPQVLYNGTRLGGCVDTIKFLKEQQVLKS